MDEKKIVCNECGTQNEPHYEFCKNCGNPLKSGEVLMSEPAVNVEGNNPQNTNAYSPYTQEETIDGISITEMAAYVGKKSYSIIPKFLNMERKRSRISWCWPVAILAWFFGPLGAAIWFFYRKLYKAAWLSVLAGLVIISSVFFLMFKDFPINMGEFIKDIEYIVTNYDEDEASDILDEKMKEFEEKVEEYTDKIEEFDENHSYINTIYQLLSYATVIICGLFAYDIYKRKAVSDIKKYRNTNVDPRYYQMGLMSIGGTSGGMLALGILLLNVIPIVIAVVTVLAIIF